MICTPCYLWLWCLCNHHHHHHHHFSIFFSSFPVCLLKICSKCWDGAFKPCFHLSHWLYYWNQHNPILGPWSRAGGERLGSGCYAESCRGVNSEIPGFSDVSKLLSWKSCMWVSVNKYGLKLHWTSITRTKSDLTRMFSNWNRHNGAERKLTCHFKFDSDGTSLIIKEITLKKFYWSAVRLSRRSTTGEERLEGQGCH